MWFVIALRIAPRAKDERLTATLWSNWLKRCISTCSIFICSSSFSVYSDSSSTRSFADAVLADGDGGSEGYVAKCGRRLHRRRWLHAAAEAPADCFAVQSLVSLASAETGVAA